MSEKPTYKELEQKIKLIEDEVVKANLKVIAHNNSKIELATILAKTPLFMIIVDQERRVKKVSDAILDFTGKTEEEILGLRGGEALRCVYHMDDPKGCGFGTTCENCTVRNTVLDTIETGNSHQKVEAKLSFIGDKVEERTLLVSTSLLDLPDKRVLVFIEDITEHKKAEDALKESEERLKGFYRAAFEGIAITEQGKFVDFNRQFTELFGYERDELVGREAVVLVAEEDRVLVLNNIRSGFDQPYEVKALKKDGSVIFIEVHGQQIQFQGRPARVTAVHDLTERIRAEEALKESEEKYRRLFESLIDVFYQTDSSGKITMVSPSITKAAGYKQEEVIGSDLKDYYINPDERNKFLELISTNGFVENFEVQMKKRDGSVLWASVNAGLSKDQEGNVVGIEGVARDITDRKRVEEEREKLINELQKALKEIKTLRGILPLCSFCKKIRDDKGYWKKVDVYIHQHTEADVSHGICPECAKEHYPDLDIYDD